MLKEFREFIARGNVMELAVAVILGAAFNQIVNSLVEDVITPAVLNPAMVAAGVDQLANLTWNGVAYGNFLAAVVNFLIVAFVLFLLVRTYNNFMKRFEAPAAEEKPGKTHSEEMLEEIRDLLAKRPLTEYLKQDGGPRGAVRFYTRLPLLSTFVRHHVNAARLGYTLAMSKTVKKSDLPSKTCQTCGLTFTWRKKWAKNWAEVRYCSERCRRNKRRGQGA